MNGPWRLRCPDGHTSVFRSGPDRGRTSEPDHWYCKTCGDSYGHAVDAKTGREVTP